MLKKIRNLAKKNLCCLYGGGLLFLSLCAIAFGGAYMGMNAANRKEDNEAIFYPTDELCEQDCG